MTQPVDSRVLSRDHVLTDPRLGLFQKVLLVTDGSVTELLCIYTGQAVRAHKLEQHIGDEAAVPLLDCPAGTPLLHRRILLVDPQGTPLVYAASAFILARLSERARTRLLHTDAPIGQLWKEEKSEMYREIIDMRVERDAAVAAHFALPPQAALLSRTYLLRQGGQPLGVITEKFPEGGFRG